jgi:AcrR family transcriptional regulator
VSHQAPYYYFADREAIIGAIAEQGFRIMREYVQRSAPVEARGSAREQNNEAGGAPHEAIVAAGRAYLEFALAHRAHFRVMFRPELVSPERHPNVRGEGIHACDTFYRIVSSAVAAGLPADPSVDALFLFCWSVVHGLACLALDGPLDVVMPDVDRQTQLRDVLSTFARMTDASFRQAQGLTKPPLTDKVARKSASKAKTSRAAPRGKKSSEARR